MRGLSQRERERERGRHIDCGEEEKKKEDKIGKDRGRRRVVEEIEKKGLSER